jgi:adenosylhomocysteine nucleosidase
LVVALAAERRALQRSLRDRRSTHVVGHAAVVGRLADRDVILLQAGIGRDRARRAVAAAAREFDLRGVWSLGFAGGLCDALRPGALVCPAAVLDDVDPSDGPVAAERSHAHVCAALRAAGLTVAVGALITVGAPQCIPEVKRALGQRSGAMVVDMEAAGVVRTARDLRLPWVVLKAVVDAVDDPLPAFLAACTTLQGDLRWGGLWTGVREGRVFWQSVRRIGRASRLAGGSVRSGLEAAFGAWAALTPV